MCFNELTIEMNTIEHRLKLEKSLQDAVLIHNDHELTMESLLKINKENVKQVINSTTSGSHTLLYKACRNGNPDIVRLLLSNGAVARPHYYTKYSPLYIACHMGNYQISKLILEVKVLEIKLIKFFYYYFLSTNVFWFVAEISALDSGANHRELPTIPCCVLPGPLGYSSTSSLIQSNKTQLGFR